MSPDITNLSAWVVVEIRWGFCSAALMHFCHSGSDVKVVCHTASEAKDTLKSNLGIQSIRTETLIGMAFQFCSKCGLDLICKNHISCFISVQTVLNQSGSAEEKKKTDLAGSLNKSSIFRKMVSIYMTTASWTGV